MTAPKRPSILHYDPFASDKDDGGFKHKHKKVVNVRRGATCFCDDPHTIPEGSEAVRYSAVSRGEGWRSFLICADCINSYFDEWEGNDE